jgi:hypothetical protein
MIMVMSKLKHKKDKCIGDVTGRIPFGVVCEQSV